MTRDDALALEAYTDFDLARCYLLLQASDDGGWVMVESHSLPATFWRFTIGSCSAYDGELRQYTAQRIVMLTTGSGAFADYWPIAEQIAEGMLVIKEIRQVADLTYRPRGVRHADA